jgi:N4-gp56 family major capsid protein
MAVNTKSVLSDSVVDLMNQAVIVSGNSYNKIDAYATIRQDDMANSIAFTVFSRMAAATTPLTDGTEASSTTMTDTKVQLTMAEYGAVITSTSLANIATAGKADLASAELVGVNLGETTDKLGLAALEAGTSTTAAATSGTLVAADLRGRYTALANNGIAKFPDGRYVAFINPSQVSDIKGDYITIAQNTDIGQATSGVVGALEGFTIVEDSNVTAGKVVCFGMNALGKAVALSPQLRVVEGSDNLGRTVNVGWYGVMKYGVIDQNALRVLTGV